MKFLKKNLKIIMAFILGTLLTGGIVYATSTYLACNVTYTKNGTTISVADALDDLYGKIPSADWKKENFSFTISEGERKSATYNLGYIPQMVLIKYFGENETRFIWSFDGCQNFYFAFMGSGTSGFANDWMKSSNTGFTFYEWYGNETFNFEIYTIK